MVGDFGGQIIDSLCDYFFFCVRVDNEFWDIVGYGFYFLIFMDFLFFFILLLVG